MEEVAAFLDRELDVGRYQDVSHNGLQVQNSGRIDRVCCGVDASMELFEEAAARGAGLVVCHHGLSWGDSLKRITGINYRRLAFLIRHDMALYACHLPLDAHPRYGNNAQIFKALGLRGRRRFGLYGGVQIGYAGAMARPVRFETFCNRVRRVMGNELRTMKFGKKSVRTVAVVSGGAADEVQEAGEKGIDVYVSGEAKLAAYHLAREYGLHAVFAGHYATEVFGVRALANMLRRRCGLEADFVDRRVEF